MTVLNSISGQPQLSCDMQSGFNAKVLTLLTVGNSIYVGGEFTQYRGLTANYIAKLNLPNCELDTTFSPTLNNGFNNSVSAITTSGSDLYVGGNFTSYRGGAVGSANRIAKLDLLNGTLNTTFNPPGNNGFNAQVNALVISGNSIFVGGEFTSYKSVVGSANRLAKLSLNNGTIDTIFSPPANNGFDENIYALAISGNNVYVGGSFYTYKDGDYGSAQNIAKLNLTSGDLDINFSPSSGNGFDGRVNAIAISGTSIYVGGAFYTYRNNYSNYIYSIAKLDLSSGELDTTFSPSDSNGFTDYASSVNSFLVSGSSIYVGGEFNSYRTAGFLSANYLVKLDLISGDLDTTFSQPGHNGFDSTVYGLALSGTNLFVGGDFNINKNAASSAQNIAKLDLTSGALDTQFSPSSSNGFNSGVNALVVSGSSLYVGGFFTNYRGIANSAKYLVAGGK